MSEFWCLCAAGGFLMGLYVGAWLENRLWRGKAVSGFRMASGGKLYTVHEEHE